MAVVQEASASSAASATSLSVALAARPTKGRVLVACVASDKSAGAYTPPDGMTILQSYIGPSVSGAIAWKVADGNESAVLWQQTTGQPGGINAWVAELEETALDTSVEGTESDIATTSRATGTTGATKSDGFAVSMMAADTASGVSAGRAWSNGFTERAYVDGPVSGDPGLSIATRSVPEGGTVTSTFSTTDPTGDQMYAALAVFRKPRSLMLRGTSGATGDSGVIVLTQGAVGGESVVLLDHVKGMVGEDAVIRLNQLGGVSGESVVLLDQLGPIGAESVIWLDVLDGAHPTDAGYVLAPAIGYRAAEDDAPTWRGLVLSTPDLLSWWRLDEAAGSAAADEMILSPGVYTSTHTKGAAGALMGDPRTAVTFGGGYVDAADAATRFLFPGTAPMTVALWMYATTVDGSGRYMLSRDWSDGSGRQGWNLQVYTGGIQFERWRDNAADFVGVTTGEYAWSANRWHLVIATYDGSTMTLDIDGAQRDSASAPKAMKSGGTNLRIGNGNGVGSAFLGRLDEPLIVGRAMSPAERAALWNRARGLG